MPQDTESTISPRDLDRVIAARQQLRAYAPYSPVSPARQVRRTSRVRPLIQHSPHGRDTAA